MRTVPGLTSPESSESPFSAAEFSGFRGPGIASDRAKKTELARLQTQASGQGQLRPVGRRAAAIMRRTKREATMAETFTGRKRVRKFFGKIQEVAEMPNLIEVQKASYDQFLLVKDPPGGRSDEGLQA